jgi:hypothetical protein
MINDKNITSYGSLETFSHYVKVTIAPMLMTVCVGIITQMYTSFHKGDAEVRSVDGSFPLEGKQEKKSSIVDGTNRSEGGGIGAVARVWRTLTRRLRYPLEMLPQGSS